MSSTGRRDTPRWVAPLGEALAEALPRLYGTPAPGPLLELIEALTKALERGELTLDLRGPAPEGTSPEGWPEVHRRALEASPLGRAPHGPLALEGFRVGWRRWHSLRGVVMEGLVARAQRRHPSPGWEPPASLADPQQRRAVATAVERDLLVLAGGPGTGKTSTVAHILKAVAQQQKGTRIHLAAPTGKAAARLRAATAGQWPCTTLHQLLESRGEGEFRRNRQRPLKLDLLVVDEVSMVDLVLMEAVLAALPQEARLVLVGDPAQLPPVAPGAPLQELLQDEELRERLDGAVVTLQTTYRNAGAIAAVAAALREQIHGEGKPAADPIGRVRPQLAGLGSKANVRWVEAGLGRLPPEVESQLRTHMQALAAAAEACTAGTAHGWSALSALRDGLLVLTPRHRGPWGVEAVHRQLLGDAAAANLALWPNGTPVLCTRNLHDRGLSNGDLGVLVAGEDRWLVFGQDDPIWLHPSQLTGVLEPALALTVHKAQGSEAERVIVLLPEPVGADARLLYTALTRARQEAWLVTPAE